LLAWEVIRQHPQEGREAESGFRVAQLFLEQLKNIRLQGCSLEEWKQVSLKLKEQAQLLWFAEVWEKYISRLSALSLMDEVDVLYAATDALRQKRTPEQLRRVSRVFVHELEQTTPLEQRFFFALDKALYSAGGELFLETRGVDNPELDGFVDELHGEFERAEESSTSTLSLLRNVLSPSAPAFELCRHLFGQTHVTEKELPLDFFVAPNPCREAKETARRIAHLLKQGVSPEAIAVVLCSDATWAHAVWSELSSHSIPAHIQEEPLLSSCALGNAVLCWPKWIEDGFPMEQAHTFFSNPLFEKTFVHYNDFGIWLQRAGIGLHSKQESLEEYVIRLSLLQESAQLDGVQEGFIEALKKQIKVAQHAAQHIPEEGSFEDMLDGWWTSLQELGFNVNALAQGQFQAGNSTVPWHSQHASFNAFEQHIHLKTLARENAAGACFKQAFLDWRWRLQKTGAGLQRLTRKEFSEWVLSSFGNERLHTREPKTAGVRVSHFQVMRGEKYRHIFFLGMKEGAFSQRNKMALIPEALQSLVNASGGRLFFKTQRGESLHKLPEDIVVERRNFAQAVACATQQLCFSYSLAEHDGREATPSSFWKEALRIAGKTAPTPSGLSFCSQLSECVTDADFRGYVAQRICRNVHKQMQEAPAAKALGQERWFLSLSEKSKAQKERLHFQRDRTQKAGPYTGKALSPTTQKHLQELTQLPWSAYAFGMLGGCAFRFFMAHVLKGEVFENFNADVGGRARGLLLHRALALLGDELVSLSKTRENEEEAQQRKRAAKLVKAAQEALEPQHCLVHPELWALCCEQAEEALFGFLNSKSLFPWGAPRQAFAEWSFEEEVPLGNSEEAADIVKKRVLKLKGRLDRLDFLDDNSVGVVDYKLSKRGSKNKYQEGLLLDDFQLLLYLFVLKRKGFQAKHASWVFIREKAHFLLEEVLPPEALKEVLEENPAACLSLKKAGKPNLLNRLEALLSKVEEGEFAPTPADCEYCPFQRACRVSEKTTLQADSP